MELGLPHPAAGVPQMLRPHVACVSTYRYPTLPQLGIETTFDYLLQAPKVTREVSSVVWTFLDTPADGTVLLVWQHEENTQQPAAFPTDGYVWLDVERNFTQHYKGFTVEMSQHKIGFHPSHETVATHARRRYRLKPYPGGSTAPCDTSLWIVHYLRADASDHVPANRVPLNAVTQQLLLQRRSIQQAGQLIRKEFMLHDKANWPHLQPPGLQGPMSGRAQQLYGNAMDQNGPPAKRARPGALTGRPGQGKMAVGPAAVQDYAIQEDHEDRDLFDVLTPRDISNMRFTKHTEWMEEIFSSPWDTTQIDPVPLGLGRRGFLAPLTEGLLDAPAEPTLNSAIDLSAKPLGPEKFAELERRAKQMEADVRAEIAQMDADHAKQLEEIRNGSIYLDAEKSLRDLSAKDDPFKLTSGFRDLDPSNKAKVPGSVQEIVKFVEDKVEMRVQVLEEVECIEKGGLVEKEPSPPPQDFAMEDTEMGDGAQDALAGSPNFAEFTTELDNSPQSGSVSQPPPPTQQAENTGAPHVQAGTRPQGAAEDWVVVDKQNVQPPIQSSSDAIPATGSIPTGPTPVSSVQHADTSAAELGADLVQYDSTPDDDNGDFQAGEFNDSIDFGDNMDTAGEALAGFEPSGSGDNMGMTEDTAFGDAFHQTEASSNNPDGQSG